MAARVALTEEEYLRTSFPDLDREFRDGEVVERSMPDWFHSRTQHKLSVVFARLEDRLPIQVAPDLRVKIRPGLIRIPDLCVFWPAEPPGQVPDRCPLIVIEILSEDDRLSAVRNKLMEYADWGIAHVWMVDPRRRLLYVFEDGLHEVKSFTAGELSLTLTAEDFCEPLPK